jgi:hypothetical protein
MVTHLRRHEQQLLTQLFSAFSSLDGAGMARAALAFSADHQTCPDPDVRVARPTLFRLWQESERAMPGHAFLQ